MKKERIFEKLGIICTFLVTSYCAKEVYDASKSNEELKKQTYQYDANLLLSQNTYDNVAFLNTIPYFETYSDKDSTYTDGISIYNYLIDNNIDCFIVDNKYYSIDGRDLCLVYNNAIKVVDLSDIEEYKYQNNTIYYVHTIPYEELKDYELYYDVLEDKVIRNYRGNNIYRATKKLIK